MFPFRIFKAAKVVLSMEAQGPQTRGGQGGHFFAK